MPTKKNSLPSGLPQHMLNKEVAALVAELFVRFREEASEGSLTIRDVVNYVQIKRPGTRAATVYPCIAAYGPVGEEDTHWQATGVSRRYGRYEV